MRKRLSVLSAVAIGIVAGIHSIPRAAASQSNEPSNLTVVTKPTVARPGDVVVLTVSTASDISGVRVQAFGREDSGFPVDAHTWRVLVGIDLDTAPRAYSLTVEATEPSQVARTTHRLVITPRQFRTRKL